MPGTVQGAGGCLEKQGEGKPSQRGRTRRMCRKTTVCPAGGVERRDPCLGKFEKEDKPTKGALSFTSKSKKM